jgi:hypothetical protein
MTDKPRPERISMTDKPTPFAYAYRYPTYPPEGATVIRFGTGGCEINGSKPIEAIPLFTADQIIAMHQASDTGDDDAEWLRRKLANGFHGAISEETAARLERIADRLQAKAHEGEG